MWPVYTDPWWTNYLNLLCYRYLWILCSECLQPSSSNIFTLGVFPVLLIIQDLSVLFFLRGLAGGGIGAGERFYRIDIKSIFINKNVEGKKEGMMDNSVIGLGGEREWGTVPPEITRDPPLHHKCSWGWILRCRSPPLDEKRLFGPYKGL